MEEGPGSLPDYVGRSLARGQGLRFVDHRAPAILDDDPPVDEDMRDVTPIGVVDDVGPLQVQGPSPPPPIAPRPCHGACGAIQQPVYDASTSHEW